MNALFWSVVLDTVGAIKIHFTKTFQVIKLRGGGGLVGGDHPCP